MNILIKCKKDSLKQNGGDVTQINKTIEYLIKLNSNLNIDIDDGKKNYSNYDLFHVFGVVSLSEIYLFYKKINKYNKPIILSPIYNPIYDIEQYHKKYLFKNNFLIQHMYSIRLIELLRNFLSFFKYGTNFKTLFYSMFYGYNYRLKYILKNSTFLLPNSQMEMEAINEDLNIKNNNYSVVYNAIEDNIKIPKHENNKFIKEYSNIVNIENYIVVPARIEPLKNQLYLIDALKDLDIQIVFIGGTNNKHKKYVEKFMRKINENKNLIYLGMIDRETLMHSFVNAKTIVLPSWTETTGLVGIEAAIMKCNVVITERGYTKSYFEDYAYYCNPNDLKSIRNSVLKSISENDINKKEELKKHILNNFTWEKTAEKTIEVYKYFISR